MRTGMDETTINMDKTQTLLRSKPVHLDTAIVRRQGRATARYLSGTEVGRLLCDASARVQDCLARIFHTAHEMPTDRERD